jgi:hypothetical protein
MDVNSERFKRYIGFPLLLIVVVLSLGYQLQLAWERAVPPKHVDAAPWSVLTEGYDAIRKGRLPAELHALGEQENIALYGFVFPLEPGETHQHFLLLSHSASCPFHQLLGQGNVVEVFSTTPVRYSRDPVLLRGHLSIDEQPGADIQYRLDDAHEITP